MAEKPPSEGGNLSQFGSVEDAISKVDETRDYLPLAEQYLVPDDLTLPMLFFGSMINRCGSLHMAIARELREQNPHAVFPLLRAYSECAALLIYVYDNVEYIEALTDRSSARRPGAPDRLSVGKLVDYATKQAAPGFKHAHGELSNLTQFGSTAMWSPYVLSDDSRLSSTSYPQWKSEEQAMIAAALTLEVSEANHQLLENFGHRYLRSGKRWRGRASRWLRRTPGRT
jgi:hypothetical protein